MYMYMTIYLYQRLVRPVEAWRASGYPCPIAPAISEILAYQVDPATQAPHFLRPPQLHALETYWYLRLVAQTPHIVELYEQLFPDPDERRVALGLTGPAIRDFVATQGHTALWQRIRHDADFVRAHKLEALRESFTLTYPSYILALAMGTGKTLLIGAIIATEFALALDYPDGPFIQNALLFAPGKTIFTVLRELTDVPYASILPPRLFKDFAASIRLTFTRDGDKDLPVIRGSYFNIIVTNTEKICIRQETIRQRNPGAHGLPERMAARTMVANLRLQTLASLPDLAVFSDEAHHTYGSALGRELKRVRQTVDYLHQHSPNLIGVVNTTGTPYFARQPLRDVVIWYGLAAGIADGILKEVAGNIRAYQFDAASAAEFISEVIADFFRDYAGVRLPDGAPAKLAIYFPQTSDLEALRPTLEQALIVAGQPPTIVLTNTSRSSQSEIDAFSRLNDPTSPHRVILLVNKGTEGWNCPSLFACALARKLKTSNNFVLQAATRCLRQVPGNRTPARIYLSLENRVILERQLHETYGATLTDLTQTHRSMSGPAPACPPRPPAPPRSVPHVPSRATLSTTPLCLQCPEWPATPPGMVQPADTTLNTTSDTLDCYTATVRLATTYRLDLWIVYDELRRIYPAGACPVAHLKELSRQVEDWMGMMRDV